MRYRVTVVAVIRNNKGKVLIAKMPRDRGVFPGQWAIPGGGINKAETMQQALEREVMEEVGLKIVRYEPYYFRDDVRVKIKPGLGPEKVYMIYLLFKCWVEREEVRLNEEFEEYAWVSLEEGLRYDLNEPTRDSFVRLKEEDE